MAGLRAADLLFGFRPPRFKRYRLWYLLSVSLLGACDYQDAQVLDLTYPAGIIDLREQLPGDWDRVCVLLPYATSAVAKQLLGFSYWPAWHSDIGVMDDRSLLLTVKAQHVSGAYEVLRENADFVDLGARCYRRAKAIFRRIEKAADWHELEVIPPSTP